jgi:hypothetical protein
MTHTSPIAPVFCAGDELELVAGSYQGTLGAFVALAADPKWADTQERDGAVRRHPVEWLDHAAAASARRAAASARARDGA